jgi:hypothetical protein
MSYVQMDHAGWVQRQIDACRRSWVRRPMRKPELKALAQRKGWPGAPEKLSLFQARTFDILGIVGGGIYNAPIDWDNVEWLPFAALALPWRGDMATWDFEQLTTLLFLCHEARIRLDISAHRPHHLLLMFHQRSATGGIGKRHPNLAEAITDFDRRVPEDHPIRVHGRLCHEIPREEGSGTAREAPSTHGSDGGHREGNGAPSATVGPQVAPPPRDAAPAGRA